MRLIAKAIRMSRAKFHSIRLTTVQRIQDYSDTVQSRPDSHPRPSRCLFEWRTQHCCHTTACSCAVQLRWSTWSEK